MIHNLHYHYRVRCFSTSSCEEGSVYSSYVRMSNFMNLLVPVDGSMSSYSGIVGRMNGIAASRSTPSYVASVKHSKIEYVSDTIRDILE